MEIIIFKSHKKLFIFGFVLIFLCSLVFYSFSIEPKSQSLNTDNVKINNLGTSWNNTKIAYFTDTTLGGSYTLESLKTSIKKINNENPDIIIFAGNFFDTNSKKTINDNDIMTQLKQLKAPLGKFAFFPSTFSSPEAKDKTFSILGSSDFQILTNENRYLYRRNLEPLNLITINNDATREQKQTLFQSSLEQPTLLISEKPEVFNEIADYPNIQLTLSYGTYGGNINLPFINKQIAKSDYPNGKYKRNGQTLLVSNGIGTSQDFHFRFFNRPKIYIITLQN